MPQPLWGCGGYDLRQLLVAVELVLRGLWVGLRWGVRCQAWDTVRCPWGDVCNAVMARGGAGQVNGGGLPRHCVQQSHKHKGSDRLRKTNPQARSESTGNRQRRNTVQLARVSFLLWGARAHCFFFFFRDLVCFFFCPGEKLSCFYTGQLPDVPMAPLFFRWLQAPPESKVHLRSKEK